MKKSSVIILSILIALVSISIYFYKNKNKTSTINKEASDFRFKDTASIDKIFIANKNGKQILVERKSTGWEVDGKYHVRPDAIEILLYTIASVEVKTPVSKKATAGVLKIMSAKSTKIEIYSKGKKVKQYFVGHATQDHIGTFMVLTNLETGENYPEPFITHIPGFDGYLTTRYNTDAIDWRDRLVFNYRAPQIKEIKMEYNELPDSSFIIELFSMQRFGLKTTKNARLNFDEGRLKQYIAYFQNVNCEIVLDSKDKLVDSLSKSGFPFAKLTITDRNNINSSFEFFHKQPVKEKNEEYGVNYRYDPDKLFVKYNDGKDYGVAQFYVFGKILQTTNYFIPKK